jgi:hypothetical protein
VSADIVEIHWNARPHLERLGVNLRRRGIDERGKRLLEEVRRSLAGAFPGAPVLFRISVHTGIPVGCSSELSCHVLGANECRLRFKV